MIVAYTAPIDQAHQDLTPVRWKHRAYMSNDDWTNSSPAVCDYLNEHGFSNSSTTDQILLKGPCETLYADSSNIGVRLAWVKDPPGSDPVLYWFTKQ
jgi:hypothetical protein